MIRIRLKEVLQEKGMSMSMLSHESKISFSTISRIINDKNYSPTFATMERIAKALNVPMSSLYEEVPD